MLNGGLAGAGLGLTGLPEWAFPAPAQGEVVVPFTDVPESFNTAPAPETRLLDIRKIDRPVTPSDQFFTVQHLGQPEIDGAGYRLKVSGLVDQPKQLSLAEIRTLGGSPLDLTAGFECSGNSSRVRQGLASNGRWSGVPLRKVLAAAGVRPQGKEVVFFGTDHGIEKVEYRGQTYEVDQQFGRSISVDEAMAPEPLLAFELNGQPLTRMQGFPLRLIMPGWYGVANVKWLAQIHVQQDRYVGNYQARWYRTLRGEKIDDEMKWVESGVTRMRLKSVIARVTREGSSHKVTGFVLNDGTPLKAVELSIDNGPWRTATVAPGQDRYSWKLFSYVWSDAKAGEHTLVSRVTDLNGMVQPTQADLETKKTNLENNAQYPRTVMVS
jgi:DMSO/TMAO reductase YedYZ molybdopterin-dependent catalytic subunit